MKLAVIVTARPSYSRIRTALLALKAKGVDVQVIACASALLERYGRVVEVIRRDGFAVEEAWSTYEGATRETSVLETGTLAMLLASILKRMQPDAGLVIADRHEVLAGAMAVAYQHIPLIHIQGGERTGSIDDKVRDAITHLADYHLVSTERAKFRVYGMTGDWERIYVTGCPSVDLAKQAREQPVVTWSEIGGVGPTFPLDKPFVVLLQHPVTSESDEAAGQMRTTLEACMRGQWNVLAIWPGQDAGSESMSKVMREYQKRIHTVRNIPPIRFVRLLIQASAIVGNSSVSVRECSYLGTPAVLIGSRQDYRETGPNVVRVGHDVDAIQRAVAAQVRHGRYERCTLYGDGAAGERIADVICGIAQGQEARVHAPMGEAPVCGPRSRNR